MDIERAKEITSACVHTITARMLHGKVVPLPKCSLEEMLLANRLVNEMPEKRVDNGNGSITTTVRVRCDPRIVALHYAFEHYESDPCVMLEALGFKATATGDEG